MKRTLLAIAVAALCFGAQQAFGIWQTHRLHAVIVEIARSLPARTETDPSATFDEVRTYVNAHSRHLMDAEFASYADDPLAIAEEFLKTVSQKRSDPVHLECSRRTFVMRKILETLGYETREIDLYDNEDLGRQHTFLEVRNPVTRTWETQDPDYDLYWRDRTTTLRTALTLNASDLSEIEPCGRSECGWHIVAREGQRAMEIKALLDYMVVIGSDARRYTVYSPRVELQATHTYREKFGNFCDVLGKNCRDGFVSIEEHKVAAAD
jgi:hypothetical protein